MAGQRDAFVVVGRIVGLYGVRGWVKVQSHTSPRENLLTYSPWYLRSADGWRTCRLAETRLHGKGLVARLEGYEDREAAASLVGFDIAVTRAQLPDAEPDEYYWADLEGLRVSTVDGFDMGVVDHLMATGANDVLVIRGERERLVPFVHDVVLDVDLEEGRMRVDWDPEF